MKLRYFAIINAQGNPTGDIIKRKVPPSNVTFYEIPINKECDVQVALSLDFQQAVPGEVNKVVSAEIQLLNNAHNPFKLSYTASSVSAMRTWLNALGTLVETASTANTLVGTFTLDRKLFVSNCGYPKITFTSYTV